MPLPTALEEWMADPTQVRTLVLKDIKLTGDPDTGADKITCRVFDKETGEELLSMSVMGWVGLYNSYESLKAALLAEARRRLRAIIDQENRRRAKAVAFATIQPSGRGGRGCPGGSASGRGRGHSGGGRAVY